MSLYDPYPDFPRHEKLADAVMHLAGVLFAVIGSVLLLIWAAGQSDRAVLTAVAIYSAALVASFVASACYHCTPWEYARPMLRRIDHAAIYLKIAGTYTPLVVLIGTGFAYVVLAVVWAIAVVGMVMKLFFWQKPGHFSTLLYIGMGWMSVALVSSLIPVVPGETVWMLVFGGIIVSAGAYLFSIQGFRFQYAIWHGAVLISSVCFFRAIAMGVAPGV